MQLIVRNTEIEFVRSKFVELRVIHISNTLEFKVAAAICSETSRRSEDKDVEAMEG